MALIGISIVVASFFLFCLRRPLWLPAFFGWSQTPRLLGPPRQAEESIDDQPTQPDGIPLEKSRGRNDTITANETNTSSKGSPTGRLAMPPPPSVVVRDDTSASPNAPSLDSADDEQTTPKASATSLDDPVPSFSLSVPEVSAAPQVVASPPIVRSPAARAAPPTFGLMAPPPLPTPRLQQPIASAHAAGSSTLPALSPLPNRGTPAPNRGAPGGLAPPPTLTAKPKKQGKEIALAPGHSPLDWARLSGHPNADLRNLPPGSGYLRVTPTMLRHYTGRKGKDAWTVLGGRVYNISPYLPFHPGGEPELLRCAARDGTKLFGEIHPWVNFEGMLSACLIGIYIPEGTKDDDSD